MSDHKNKKHKRSHRFKNYQNRNYREQDVLSNTGTSVQETSQADDINIPGFYYDPVKNKYFKIQSNNFGQQSVHTNDTIKNKLDNIEFEEKCKLQLKNRNNWINFIYDKELYGVNSSLRIKYNDNIIINSKLRNLLSFDTNDKVKKIEIFCQDSNYIYLLANFISIPFSYKILRFKRGLIDSINEVASNFNEFENLSLIERDSYGAITGPFLVKQSNLPAYKISENFIVSNYQSTNINDHKPYKINISEIQKLDDLFEEKIKYTRSYKFALWCSSVNKEMNKCAAGLYQGAEVNNLMDNFYFKLNTRRSDAFCIKFRPETNQIYAGCKNKFLYGFDLRDKVNNPVIEMEHKLCLNEILFTPYNSNLLYANDFSGEVSLWDLRSPKNTIIKYSDKVECNSRCSIQLNEIGNYLYLIPKDGHIRVFNTITNDLVKSIISPVPKELNEIYSEIPSIHLFDNLSMLYGINNKLMYFSI